MKETKARKFKIAGVLVMVALLFVLMVSTIHGSSASPPAPPYTDSYDLDYTTVTYYATWHPDFEIWRWGCEYDSSHPQYAPTEDVDIKKPDGSTLKTVKRGDFCQYHLEGSGFIYLGGEWKIINLIDPDPYVDDKEPWTADPVEATFDVFTHVDWGLDAPYTHYGLVPWRTVATNIRGTMHVSKSIPLDSWVYIPEFKDLWVPVARTDDLGSGSTLWNPADESHTNPVHFDWFQHDGYFKVTDISWSLPDNNDINGTVVDGKWIDIFGSTTKCYEYVQALVDPSWTDHLDIKVYPYIERPAFVDGGDVFYRYMEVIEFTNPDTATTVAKNYDIYTGWPNDTEQVAFGNFFGANYQSDVDDMLVKASAHAYAAYDTPPPHWVRWAVPASAGITVGDLDGDGVDENIMFQEDGVVYAGFDSHYVWGWDYRWEQPASSTPLPITSGDYDGDGDDDLAMLNNSGDVGIVFVQNGMGYESLMVSANATCLATGDMDGDVDIKTGEGKEEILVCSDAGVQWLAYDPPSGNVAFTTITTKKATAAGAIKLDPDNRSDILAVFEGQSGVHARYTSHKNGWVKYMDETPEWIAPIVVKLDEWYPGSGGCPYAEWELYKWYAADDYVEYDGDAYKCTYYHYSLPGWEPDRPQMWAVWQNLGPCN